jgi:hypothetical protein
MKPFFLSMTAAMMIGASANSVARAGDEGFAAILDKEHTDGWKYIGDGEMIVRDGVASTSLRKGGKNGLYWFQKKSFADFTLKLEFNIDTATSNSGILVRFPDPGTNYETAAGQAYEIDIYGRRPERSSCLPSACARAKSCRFIPATGTNAKSP